MTGPKKETNKQTNGSVYRLAAHLKIKCNLIPLCLICLQLGQHFTVQLGHCARCPGVGKPIWENTLLNSLPNCRPGLQIFWKEYQILRVIYFCSQLLQCYLRSSFLREVCLKVNVANTHPAGVVSIGGVVFIRWARLDKCTVVDMCPLFCPRILTTNLEGEDIRHRATINILRIKFYSGPALRTMTSRTAAAANK